MYADTKMIRERRKSIRPDHGMKKMEHDKK
jgi:hypothetical protein